MPTGPTSLPASPLGRVCVFCGSSPGRDLGLVYGGGMYVSPHVHELLALLEAHEPGVEPKWTDA